MNPQGPQSRPAVFAGHGRWRIDAGAIVDAVGVWLSPGSMLLEVRPARDLARRGVLVRGRQVPVGEARVLAVGRPAEIDRHPAVLAANGAAGLARVKWPTGLVIPGLVNAHTHLDLTHIGPRHFEAAGGFVGWVDMVRSGRAQEAGEIGASVRAGVERSLLGGVVAVGDVAGAPRGVPQIAPLEELAASVLSGVSFAEFFSIGKTELRAREVVGAFLERHAGAGTDAVRLGLQPHATNTVSLASFRWAIERAAERGMALMTHVAETMEERQFIAEAGGPQRELLERLGVWDDSILRELGRGMSPVGHFAPAMTAAREAGVPLAMAHVNDASDADIEILAKSGVIVCYCPRASSYFRTHEVFGGHRYREMMSAGVAVALGTDSIVNLPMDTALADGPGISTLDEMRFLYRRDGMEPRMLLSMATVNGARALAMDPARATFGEGVATNGVVAIELGGVPASAEGALRTALAGSMHPQLLCMGNSSC